MQETEKINAKRTLCDVYSRVVGWITPLHRWNKGKRAEWNDRKPYNKQLED